MPIIKQSSDRLTPDEAADLIGVKPGTLAVWRATKRYSLPYLKIGTRVYYARRDVEAFLDQCRQSEAEGRAL